MPAVAVLPDLSDQEKSELIAAWAAVNASPYPRLILSDPGFVPICRGHTWVSVPGTERKGLINSADGMRVSRYQIYLLNTCRDCGHSEFRPAPSTPTAEGEKEK